MYTIYDNMTGERVSSRSYASADEANHDYAMNEGHTRVGTVPTTTAFRRPLVRLPRVLSPAPVWKGTR